MASAIDITTFPYTETAFSTHGWKAEQKGKGSWAVNTSDCLASITSGESNAWLISPAIDVNSSAKYTFDFDLANPKSSYPNSKVDFYILDAQKADATVLAQFDQVVISQANVAYHSTYVYEPNVDGLVYFAIVDRSNGSNGWQTKLTNFSINMELSVRMPNKATDLTYTTTGDEGNIITLSWTNPTVDSFGDALNIKEIRVDRQGATIATLSDTDATTPGANVSFTDPTPQSGFVTYSIVVVATDGAESKPATLNTDYVGTFAGLTPTVALGFKDDPFMDMWSYTTAIDGSPTWTVDGDNNGISVAVSYQSALDATAASPVINLFEGHAYKVTYTESATNPGNKCNYSLVLTNTDNEIVLRQMAQCNPPKVNSSYANGMQQVSYIFSPEADGQYALSFHATAEKMTASYYNNTITMSNIVIEEIPVVPGLATDVAAATNNTDGTITLTWATPATNETGIALTGLTATILRDGTEVATIDATPGATETYTDTPDQSGYHSYAVIIKNYNGACADAPVVVLAPYFGASLNGPFVADFAQAPTAWCGMEFGDKANGNKFVVDAATGTAYITEIGKEFADALVSAPVILRADRVYTVSATCLFSTSNYTENVQVYLLSNIDDLATGGEKLVAATVSNTDKVFASNKFRVDADGEYYIAIKTVNLPYTSSVVTLTVKAFGLEYAPLTPGVVTELSARCFYDDPCIDITFTLPTHSSEGVELLEKLTANIHHGDINTEPVGSIDGMPGETLTWRHQEANANAFNTYHVTVTLPDTETHGIGGTSTHTTTSSDWCGRGIHLPWTVDGANEEHRNLWTAADLSSTTTPHLFEWNAEKNVWVVEETTNHYTSSSTLDDWLISPALYILDEATYTISFDALASGGSGYTNYAPKYAIYVGDTPNIDDLKNESKSLRITEKDLRLEREEGLNTYSHSFSYSPEEIELAASRADATSAPSKKFVALRFGEKYNSSYGYVELSNIKINTNILTGIEGVKAQTPAATLDYSMGKVVATDGTSTIYIFTPAGSLVATGIGEVSVANLNAGVYIARTAHAAIKFAK